jgi:hypothetical protein
MKAIARLVRSPREAADAGGEVGAGVNVAVGVGVGVGVRVDVGVRVSVAVGVGVSVGVGTASDFPQLPEPKMTTSTTTTPRMPPATGTRRSGFLSLANAVHAPLFCD